MRVEQSRFTADLGWQPATPGARSSDAELVLTFASRAILRQPGLIDSVREAYPHAIVAGCSTAGEINGTSVLDDSLSVTAVSFEGSRAASAWLEIDDVSDSFKAGERLAGMLQGEDLVHVVVFSDGLNVNGSDLVRGLSSRLPPRVTITGGLAGDGDRFEETLVVCDGAVRSRAVSVVGLYGTKLQIGCGSVGGWDSFGPERLITRSRANVLHELDGRSALDLYKSYLGEHANGLPATGLLFPLSVRASGSEHGVVRTILSVDQEQQSLTFAGDVPEGSYARLMKANFDRLIDGAIGAATSSYESIGSFSPQLALLISCVGRKMVLKQRIEEEVEGVAEVLGESVPLTGFYSYGEISPFTLGARCELHNQTMTITCFAER